MALMYRFNKGVLICGRNTQQFSKLSRVNIPWSKQTLVYSFKMSHLLHTASSSIRHAAHYHTLVSRVINAHIYRPHFCGQRIFTTSCLTLANKPGVGKFKTLEHTKVSTKETGKTKSSSLDAKRLLSLARPERWRLAAAIGFLAVSSSVSLSVPYFIGQIIDLIYKSDSHSMMTNLNNICAVLLGVFVIGGIANFGRVYILQTSSQRIVKRLRELLFSRILRQEVAFFDKTKTGELVNRLSMDTSVVAQSLSQNISDGLRSTFQACAGLGMMTYVSTKLTLISMCMVPPVVGGAIIYGRYLRRITKGVQDSLAESTQIAEERISNIRTVRAFSQENKEREAYRQGVEHVLQLSYKEAWARAIFYGFTGFSGNVIIISTFYFGGNMMIDSSISMGDLSAFMLYAAYVGLSMGGLTGFYTELNRGIAASQRIWELIDRQPKIELDHNYDGSSTPSVLDGDIRFNDVAFNYPARSDTVIFSGLDLHIPAGSVTAVVGPSGSGKSTIGSLLLRFYDPIRGQVTLDGCNIQNLDPHWLRTNISTVSQEPVLFSTTISENIAYGSEDPSSVTTEEIFEAARKANALNFVNNFPDGFDTLVGERGLMLSGGQRQRIAIARAVLKDPKVLILDEATSALDAESEHLVQEALEGLMKGRTVLTIAHRLSTIKSADQIAVIDQGMVVENGTYSQLMTIEDGLFKRLVERQTIQNIQ